MRIIIILLLVSLCCLVGAKYLPDDSGSRVILRNERSIIRDNLDNASESQSNESNNDDDTDDNGSNDNDDENDSLEIKRQQQLAKIERKRQEEQRKLEEKRVKEERKRQEELEKEQRKKEKIEAKFEEERRKLEEKLEKEERKRKEKIEKEERKKIEKLAEEERKQQEKLAKEERKKQENINKKLSMLAKETVTQQNEPINSAESEEDLDFEDIWKNYIYEKYGLTQTSTDLSKKAAVNRYLQEELGLNPNSTKSEYHQAVLQLVQTKLAVEQSPSNSQGGFQNYLTSHVNAAYIQKLQTEIETKISELENDTALLQNVSLPWVPQARYAIEQKKTLLTTITQYLSNILPNWITGNNPSLNNTVSTPSTNTNVGSSQGIDAASNSNTNNLLTLDDVASNTNSNTSTLSTEGSLLNQPTESATPSNEIGSSNSVSNGPASTDVSEGSTSTSNADTNLQDNIGLSDAGQNEIPVISADSSSVISPSSDSASLDNLSAVSNGLSSTTVSSVTDSNNFVSVDPTSANTVSSNTFSDSGVSVSSTLVPSSTNVDVPASGVSINTDKGESSNSETSVNDSNGVFVKPISTDADVLVDSISLSTSDVSVSSTLVPSTTSVGISAAGITTSPSVNNIGDTNVEVAMSNNVASNSDVVTENAIGTDSQDLPNEGSALNSPMSGVDSTGDASSDTGSGLSLSNPLNTETADVTGGETWVANSPGTENSLTGTQIATQSTNNVATTDAVDVNNSDSTVTQKTDGLIPNGTTSVFDSASSDSVVSDITSNGPQGSVSIVPSVQTTVNTASSSSSDPTATNVVENTSSVDQMALGTSDSNSLVTENSIDSQLTNTVNINTAENSVNTDFSNNEISPTSVVNMPTDTNVVVENTIDTLTLSTAVTPVNNAGDSTTAPILQVTESVFTGTTTVDNLGGSTAVDSSLTSASDAINFASETTAPAATENVESTGVETTPVPDTTVDVNLSVTDFPVSQESVSSDNSIIDVITTATDIVNGNTVDVVHVDNSINNVFESISTTVPVAYTDVIATETPVTTNVETAAEVTATSEGVASVAAPTETHVATVNVANSTNQNTLTDGNNINTQDTVVSATDVNIKEVNGDATPSSVTEVSDISPVPYDAVAIETGTSISSIASAPTTKEPESVVSNVTSESSVNLADLYTSTEQAPLTTVSLIASEVEAITGSLNEGVNEATVSETLVTSTDSVIVTESTFVPYVDIAVSKVTDVPSNETTVSNINTETTDVPVDNAPVVNSNDITTSEPNLGVQSALVGIETIDANITTALPVEAGASLLEVTQQ